MDPFLRALRSTLVLVLLPLTAARAAAPVAAELCGPPAAAPNDHFVQPESTKRMIALVQEIYTSADPLRNPFRNSEQVPLLKAKIDRLVAGRADPAEIFDVRLRLAVQLLQAGQIEQSIVEHETLKRYLQEHNQPPNSPMNMILLTGEAIGHLRAGETANCLLNHNQDSCMFPIQGGGVHQLQEGSRSAVAVLTELLTRSPGDLRARWLLNIAYMTLGEYPDKVPPRWLIDPRLFASDYDIKRFPDIAGRVGLDLDSLAGGVVMEDFDHDGFLDVMASSWGFTPQDQVRLFRNQGDGTFEERTKQAGLTGVVSGLNMIHGDYDNDGFADVLILRGAWLGTEGHYPVSLLRNNGDFTFTDVTESSGIVSHRSPTQAAVWFDFNGDGLLDIFIANESTGRETNPCELFRNNGDGTFTECAAEFGIDLVSFYKGVATGDFNNDGRPDLFLSSREGAKVLLRNDGPAGADRSPKAAWRFTDVAEAAGITGQPRSFPCWFWDYDNDGWEDIMVTGYSIQDAGDIAADYLGRPHPAAKARLYRNNGNGTFTDVSRAAGVNKLLHTMGTNFGDLDNDGWLDVYIGTGDPDFTTLIPNRMFRNDGGRRFQDVTTSGGFGQLQKGHGIAFGDLDNDGDQDIYSVVGGANETDNYRNQLFDNPGHGNNWLKLELQGTKTNRVALGARVKVVVSEQGVERSIYRTVRSGASFGSSTFRQEIGLGHADTVARVEIFWPVTGVTQTFTGLRPNQSYKLCEEQPAAIALARPSFQWPKEGSGHGHHQHHHASASP